jgi:glucuronide carrier protein
VVIGFALYMFTFFTAKERVHREVPKVSMRQSLSTLKGNRPLLMLCVSSLLFLTGMLALTTAQIYYFRNVLGRLDLYPAVSIAQIALTFVLASLMPKLVAAFGKRTLYMAGGVIGMVGGLIVFFTPPSMVWLGFAGIVISVVGVVIVNILVWALEADTVEYGEWKTGVRSEGIVYALFSFTRKTGQALGGAVAAYALAWGGYNAQAEVQSSQAMLAIQAAAGLLPAGLTLLAVIVMIWYPLTDARHAEIIHEIQARRAERS